MLDPDALETLLKQEQKQGNGFQYYLRKYKGKDGKNVNKCVSLGIHVPLH